VEGLLDIVVVVLRLVPLILAFYIPALIGTVIWSERGDGYKVKAIAWFVLGFGVVTYLHVLFTSTTASQVAATIGLSVIEIAAALALAVLTVYKLAD
jgi:hypothetical protein